MNSYREIAELLSGGRITCREIVEKYLGRIEECRDLNAFISVYHDRSLEKARPTVPNLRPVFIIRSVGIS